MAIESLFDLLERHTAPVVAPTGGTWALNPRPDLTEDADRWRRLLAAAALSDTPGIYGALHGVRCCGARLVRNGTGYRIAAPGPDDGPLSYHEPDPETGEVVTWEADREDWLVPHREELVRLLRGLDAAP